MPERRRFIAVSAGAAAMLAGAGASGCDAGDERVLRFANLDDALAELARLEQSGPAAAGATWTWSQTLQHLAQSIEYSMSGYPEAKSPLFQRTVGTAAFHVFVWRGRMSHDRSDPIPGAPTLAADVDAAAAGERLRTAVRAFEGWQGPLRPHFAYGALGRHDYRLAHAMHLADHFSQFRAAVRS